MQSGLITRANVPSNRYPQIIEDASHGSLQSVLYDTLVNVMATLLLDVLHLVFHLVGSVPACLAVFAPPLCGLT